MWACALSDLDKTVDLILFPKHPLVFALLPIIVRA